LNDSFLRLLGANCQLTVAIRHRVSLHDSIGGHAEDPRTQIERSGIMDRPQLLNRDAGKPENRCPYRRK
jgi:hypothetical protein